MFALRRATQVTNATETKLYAENVLQNISTTFWYIMTGQTAQLLNPTHHKLWRISLKLITLLLIQKEEKLRYFEQ